MDDALTLPARIADEAVGSDGGTPGSLQDAKRALSESLAERAARAASADPVDAAVARLLSQHCGNVDPFGDEAVSNPAPDGHAWGDLLYDAAAAAVARGRLDEAIALLAGLMPLAGRRLDALLGLSVCAARLGCYEDALILALASRGSGPGHPRASCVAGLCELERGNRRAAQAYLAVAARLARGRPDCRDDLRQAQRTLLLMHIA